MSSDKAGVASRPLPSITAILLRLDSAMMADRPFPLTNKGSSTFPALLGSSSDRYRRSFHL
jgi:hypothetical protein